MSNQDNTTVGTWTDGPSVSQGTIDRMLRIIGAVMIQSAKDLTLKITPDGGLEFEFLHPEFQTAVRIYPDGPFYLTSTEPESGAEEKFCLTSPEEERLIQLLFVDGIEAHKEKV